MSNKNAIRFVQSVAALSNPSISVDGVIGPMTRKAVSSFNKKEINSVNTLLVGNGFPAVDKLIETQAPVSTREFPDDWYRLVDSVKIKAPKRGLNAGYVLAQLAIESGWGRSVPKNGSVSSYNFGGIKSNSAGQSSGVTTGTKEFENGEYVKTTASWAVFKSIDDFVDAYLYYLLDGPSSYRYKGITRVSSAKEFGDLLHHKGYATDPKYGQKLASVHSGVTRRGFA